MVHRPRVHVKFLFTFILDSFFSGSSRILLYKVMMSLFLYIMYKNLIPRALLAVRHCASLPCLFKGTKSVRKKKLRILLCREEEIQAYGPSYASKCSSSVFFFEHGYKTLFAQEICLYEKMGQICCLIKRFQNKQGIKVLDDGFCL